MSPSHCFLAVMSETAGVLSNAFILSGNTHLAHEDDVQRYD